MSLDRRLGVDLSQRAADAGVATSYLDWAQRRVDVSPEAVAATLDLVGPPQRPALVTAGPAPVATDATVDRWARIAPPPDLPVPLHGD